MGMQFCKWYRNWYTGVLAVVLISGCQSTFIDEKPTEQVNQSDELIEPESVVEVMHPQNEIVVELPVPEPLSPSEMEDLWQRISMQFSFAIPEDRRIAAQRDWYLRHPKYMQRVMQRARPFLFYIVEQLEAHDMPLELTLLPIVESAFDPFAYSHSRAAGMWQFIPGTAKRFGMRQSWWYDGRRDVIASTNGAIEYLTYLHKYFDGDWLHALAAYNSGEGRVKRAIRNNKRAGKPTDFWSLGLPKETRAYVPKLLALADIVSNQEKYKYAWPKVENAQVVAMVDIESQLDLALASELANMRTDELHALNPGFNRWATDPDGPHHLMLPLAKVEKFKQALAKTDRSERFNWVRHKIKSGDSLIKLAKIYHTTPDVIRQVNRIKGNRIIAGKHLMVPVASKALESYKLSNESRLAATQNKPRAQHKLNYTVNSGDTLWDISRAYKVSVSSLAKWNGMAPSDPLKLGKKLVVWTNADTSEANANAVMRKVVYRVRRGDSLSRIASRFGVKTKDIVRWNDLNAKRYLQPGQSLTLHINIMHTAG